MDAFAIMRCLRNGKWDQDVYDTIKNHFWDNFDESLADFDIRMEDEFTRGVTSFLLCVCASSHIIDVVDELKFLKFGKKMVMLMKGQIEMPGSRDHATEFHRGFHSALALFSQFNPYDEEFAQIFKEDAIDTIALYP